MAKERNNLDQFFKEKLENHTEIPSTQSWDRLESQLPLKSKSYKGVWWAAAASLTLLFTVGYLVMREGNNPMEKQLLSDNKTELLTAVPFTDTTSDRQIETTKLGEIENQPQTQQEKYKSAAESTKAAPIDSYSQAKKPQPTPSQNLIAVAEVGKKEAVEVIQEELLNLAVEAPEFTQAILPSFQLETTLAAVSEPAEEEPTYRIKIYSTGLTEEPKDKNLLAEIGKTVNEVEGLLGKVDQGFADLQDAKNNLFASITTRKSKSED